MNKQKIQIIIGSTRDDDFYCKLGCLSARPRQSLKCFLIG